MISILLKMSMVTVSLIMRTLSHLEEVLREVFAVCLPIKMMKMMKMAMNQSVLRKILVILELKGTWSSLVSVIIPNNMKSIS